MSKPVPQNVLVTGATGFVGRSLCKLLRDRGNEVRGTLLPHESPSALVNGIESTVCGPLGLDTDWTQALAGIDTVIHLAARVHILRETAADPLAEFRLTNTDGTIALARQAVGAGVKRFVFMSTIGVNGASSGSASFKEEDTPHPHNSYAQSKYFAEQALQQIAGETDLEVVIVRAPLVYGPANPGNFLELLRIVQRGVPLPLASVANRRSLLYVGNLVDALDTCSLHPCAVGQTFLVSDGEDISTPELLRRMAFVLGVPSRLFSVNPLLLSLAGKLIGKSSAINSLIGSLTVDSSKIRRDLEWKPPFTMDDGLRETVKWFTSL